MEENEERQEMEIEALQSIHEDFKFENKIGIIFLEINSLKKVKLKPHGGAVQYLPPIKFMFKLVPDYPTSKPPLISLSTCWLGLDKLESIVQKLEFVEDEEILFEWIQTIKDEVQNLIEYEDEIFLEDLSFGKRSVNGYGTVITEKVSNLEKFIFDFHQAELLRDFDQKIIECQICLSTKLGKLCHVISICGHAFCQECLNQFFSTLINDGDVEIKCPEVSCGKIIPPHDVKLYVEPEVFERFDRLLLERGLDGMDDIFYCPTENCRTPCAKYDKTEDIALCGECGFFFCTHCRQSAHGSRPCQVSSKEIEKAAKTYKKAKAEGDQVELEKLRRRFGSKIEEFLSHQATMALINDISRPCPRCKTAIEKSDGCNKMTCFNCKAFFCYICGEFCDPENPYSHYQNVKSRCYGQLFLGMADADQQQDLFDIYFHQ